MAILFFTLMAFVIVIAAPFIIGVALLYFIFSVIRGKIESSRQNNQETCYICGDIEEWCPHDP